MKANDSILIQLDDGRVFAATVLSTSGGSVVARPLGSQRDLALRPDQCAPMAAAFEAFIVLPVVKCLLAQAEARAVTPPAAPALDASQPVATLAETSSVTPTP